VWSDSLLGYFILAETTPDTHWIGGWVRLRTGLDAIEKRKISLTGNRTPDLHPD
jgi:hypothetical protein